MVADEVVDRVAGCPGAVGGQLPQPLPVQRPRPQGAAGPAIPEGDASSGWSTKIGGSPASPSVPSDSGQP